MDEIRDSRAGHTRRNMKGAAAFNSFVPTPLQDIEIEWTDDLAQELAETEAALAKLAAAFAALAPEQQAELVEAALRAEAESSWKLTEGRDLGPRFDGSRGASFKSSIATDIALGSDASGQVAPDEGAQANRETDAASATSQAGSASEYLSLICLPSEDGDALSADAPELEPIELQEIDDLAAALRYALDPFDDLPVSRRLLENAHYLMTQSPRYEKLYPGEFRRSPNWIAGPKATLATARYVPPADEDMTDAFSALEHFIHEASDLPELVRIALTHYQFEAIHPFLDGNGRIGRILTLVMLRDAGLISAPILPLSDVLRERAVTYYGSIDFVEHEGEYETWVKFFLLVLREAAERALEISETRERLKAAERSTAH